MAGILHELSQQRFVGTTGEALPVTMFFYLSGTTDLADIYSDPNLTTPLTNPVEVAAGAIVPNIYLDPAIAYRRRIVYSDGVVNDLDPYSYGAVSLSDFVFYFDDFVVPGSGGTVEGDSAALKAAIAAAEATWAPVVLPARRIFWDGTLITENYVRLWGAGMPALVSGDGSLVGGTIFEGGIIFTGEYIDLRDFGADLGPTTTVDDIDGIKCLAQPYNSGKSLHTENLIALCRAPTSAVHALLFEGYAQHTGGNLIGVSGFFGVVLKTRNVRLTSLKGYKNSDTGIYLKSDDAFGSCSNVQIQSIEVDGGSSGACDYAVRLQAAGAESGVNVNGGGLLDNIQIDMIRAKGHGTSVLAQCLNFPNAAFGSVHIGTIISEGATTDDVFAYNLKPGGRFDYLEIGSIISINPAAKVVNLLNEAGAEIETVKISTIYASFANTVTDAVLDGAVFIGGSVNQTNFDSAALVVDYGRSSRLGALNYPHTGGIQVLGARRARVLGAGRPANGYSTQTLSGTSAAVAVPRNEAGDNTSFVKLTHAAPITITSFVLPANDIGFEPGHTLTLFNATNNTVTVNNNGAGGIINPAYGTVTLGENEVRTWVFAEDLVWRGLP